jgi:hypothetical protein
MKNISTSASERIVAIQERVAETAGWDNQQVNCSSNYGNINDVVGFRRLTVR